MRKTTISILAVAFTASTAACGGATTTTSGNPGQQQSAAQGEPTATNEGANDTNKDEGTAPAPTPSDPEEPAPAAPTPAACDRDALNKELTTLTTEAAVANHAHFRCLCDENGYPLVGNVNSKGATASSFCAAITEKGLL